MKARRAAYLKSRAMKARRAAHARRMRFLRIRRARAAHARRMRFLRIRRARAAHARKMKMLAVRRAALAKRNAIAHKAKLAGAKPACGTCGAASNVTMKQTTVVNAA